MLVLQEGMGSCACVGEYMESADVCSCKSTSDRVLACLLRWLQVVPR